MKLRGDVTVACEPLEFVILVRIQAPQPICKVSVSRLARGFAPRSRQLGGQVGKRIFKQFPRIFVFHKNQPLPQERVRANSFQEIFLFGKISSQSDNLCLISRQNEVSAKFEPAITLSLKILQFFGNLNFLIENFLFLWDNKVNKLLIPSKKSPKHWALMLMI